MNSSKGDSSSGNDDVSPSEGNINNGAWRRLPPSEIKDMQMRLNRLREISDTANVQLLANCIQANRWILAGNALAIGGPIVGAVGYFLGAYLYRTGHRPRVAGTIMVGGLVVIPVCLAGAFCTATPHSRAIGAARRWDHLQRRLDKRLLEFDADMARNNFGESYSASPMCGRTSPYALSMLENDTRYDYDHVRVDYACPSKSAVRQAKDAIAQERRC